MRPKTLTSYKRAVLNTLRWRSGTSKSLGDHPAQFERACRQMEQMGLVAQDLHRRWHITEAGKLELD